MDKAGPVVYTVQISSSKRLGVFCPKSTARLPFLFRMVECLQVMTSPMRDAGHAALADVATGIFQQTVAGALFTPIDIIKERLQVPC